MKKIINIGIIILSSLLLYINVFADTTSKYKVNQPSINNTSTGVKEEFEVEYDGKYVSGITAIYTIDENYDKDEIIITPKIFDKLGELTTVMPGDKIKVNFKVVNKSNHNYKYEENSFIISTEDLRNYNLDEVDGAIGFNNIPIYTPFTPYRTGNTALMSLYGYSRTSQFKDSDLTDEVLENKLIESGYKGISELNKYYLDFYNKKYNTSVTKLEDLSHKVIMELFNGNRLSVKENNSEIVELSYNWFYNKLLSYNFEDQSVNDENSEYYSIGTYMRNPILGNSYFSNTFNSLKSNETKELNNMSININGRYTVNTFMIYNFSAYMEFKLERTDKEGENKNEEDDKVKATNKIINNIDDSIIPPHTGI